MNKKAFATSHSKLLGRGWEQNVWESQEGYSKSYFLICNPRPDFLASFWSCLGDGQVQFIENKPGKSTFTVLEEIKQNTG